MATAAATQLRHCLDDPFGDADMTEPESDHDMLLQCQECEPPQDVPMGDIAVSDV